MGPDEFHSFVVMFAGFVMKISYQDCNEFCELY